VLVDLRNVYRPEDIRRHGFVYSCVGRPSTDGTGGGVHVPPIRAKAGLGTP